MTFRQAVQQAQAGKRIRRPCWQPGWVELGVFQNQPCLFYRNPTPVMVHDHLLPEIHVTYTPLRYTRTNPYTGELYLYCEDEVAGDWIVVKEQE